MLCKQQSIAIIPKYTHVNKLFHRVLTHMHTKLIRPKRILQKIQRIHTQDDAFAGLGER